MCLVGGAFFSPKRIQPSEAFVNSRRISILKADLHRRKLAFPPPAQSEGNENAANYVSVRLQ